MIKPAHPTLITFLLVLIYSPVFADINTPGWNKVKDKNGITVYIMAVEDTRIVRVKTSTIINTSIITIQEILTDYNRRPQWVPYLIKSDLLARLQNDEQVEYAHFSAPWPASDRDFVYRMRQIKLDKNTINYAMKSDDTGDFGEYDDIIRADLIESQYSLSRISDTSTRVELIFHADPKGWLPFWIINIIQKALPYMMLHNLKKLAETGSLQENS